jgi:uncharacterized hydrophobic protein (TIGR00341 family)
MPLRLLEAVVPSSADVRGLLSESPVIDIWNPPTDGERAVVRILLEAGHTERVSDVLTQAFGSLDEFRLVVLPVEATIPPVPAPEPESTAADERAGTASAIAAPLGRISREELYEDVAQAAKLTPVFLVTVVLSTIVAAVGLIRGDLAVLIGAMVIAPLLGPNIALSLACTLGDIDLARKSLRAIAAGVTTAFALSLALGLVLHVEPSSPELARRTAAGLEDIALALAAGSAGALAFTTGVPTVVVGVMVAVALLPPLVVTGLLVGSGNFHFAFSAFILVVANVTCLNLAAVATFLLQKVRPRTWWETERAARATRLAVTTWVVMLVILALLIVLRQQRIA